MILATATIERFMTLTEGLAPVTETPVIRNPTRAEAVNLNAEYLLYVTSTENPGVNSDKVGTVLKVTPAASLYGWLYRDEDRNLHRMFGAPLNPDMVNGRHYRSLGNRDMLVRFNDEAHRADRHTDGMALSILASAGVPWPFPNDSMGPWHEDIAYIQVETPAAVEPAAVMDAHQFVEDITVDGPTRGFAELDSEGRVPLDPPLVPGELYLFWSESAAWGRGNNVELRMFTGTTDNEPGFSFLGYWSMENVASEWVPYFYSNRRTILDSTLTHHWAKLALVPGPAINTDPSTVTDQRVLELGEFNEFNEATNALARDNDWCSEYEGIVEAVGMVGRTKEVNDYDVVVSVDFSFDVDSVPGRIDTEVANQYDIPDISLSNARFTGTARVTVYVSEQDCEEDARDQVDTEMIEEALVDMMSSEVDEISISDWSHHSINVRG